MMYHGSNAKIQSPEIRAPLFPRDFGKGFYCTLIREQAERWALRKKPSVINQYQHLKNINLNVLEFKEISPEWLHFVAKCRSSTPDATLHEYDLIIGPIADDKVYDHANDFLSGVLSEEKFLILAKFSYPTHQACFATEKALSALKFIKSWEVTR